MVFGFIYGIYCISNLYRTGYMLCSQRKWKFHIITIQFGVWNVSVYAICRRNNAIDITYCMRKYSKRPIIYTNRLCTHIIVLMIYSPSPPHEHKRTSQRAFWMICSSSQFNKFSKSLQDLLDGNNSSHSPTSIENRLNFASREIFKFAYHFHLPKRRSNLIFKHINGMDARVNCICIDTKMACLQWAFMIWNISRRSSSQWIDLFVVIVKQWQTVKWLSLNCRFASEKMEEKRFIAFHGIPRFSNIPWKISFLHFDYNNNNNNKSSLFYWNWNIRILEEKYFLYNWAIVLP